MFADENQLKKIGSCNILVLCEICRYLSSNAITFLPERLFANLKNLDSL